LKNLDSDFCRRPQRLSQDFSQVSSGKIFKSFGKTQFEAHLQTQAVEVGYTTFEKTWIIRTDVLLFLVAERVISADFQSQKLVMLL